VVEDEGEEDEESPLSWFTPLLSGAESLACVQRRERLLGENWAVVDARIQVLMYNLN
jgi:origin recognition complex subunit 3